MADIVPAWMWRDPQEIIEGLLRISERAESSATPSTGAPAPNHAPRDRYYTMARRLPVKQLMRSIR
jgi:hypothetical protein